MRYNIFIIKEKTLKIKYNFQGTCILIVIHQRIKTKCELFKEWEIGIRKIKFEELVISKHRNNYLIDLISFIDEGMFSRSLEKRRFFYLKKTKKFILKIDEKNMTLLLILKIIKEMRNIII